MESVKPCQWSAHAEQGICEPLQAARTNCCSLQVRSVLSLYPYPRAPFPPSLASSSNLSTHRMGGVSGRENSLRVSTTGEETFYLKMEIQVQYLHLPSAELVWDCALPNANNLQMCSKSQTEKLKPAMALNSNNIPKSRRIKTKRKQCIVFVRWNWARTQSSQHWVQDHLGLMQSKTTEPRTQGVHSRASSRVGPQECTDFNTLSNDWSEVAE